MTAQEETIKLNNLVAQQQNVLFVTRSLFPFDFFPIKITIERNKVDLVRNVFFASRLVDNILISQISRVEESCSLLFSTLKIYSIMPTEEPFVAEYLPKDDAIKARRIIEGLMVTRGANIDTAVISNQELVKNLQKLGAAK